MREEVLELVKSKLAAEHPHIATAMKKTLDVPYKELGRPEEAGVLLQQVLEIKYKLLPEHCTHG